MDQRHRLQRLAPGMALLVAGLWLVANPAGTATQTRSPRSSSPRRGHIEPPAAMLPVQWRADERLGTGKLLVASRELLDPNFEETVILLIDYNDKGTVGVVINRTTKVKLSELLPDVKGLKERSDTIYAGGPVSREEILMLVRSAQAPEDSRHVFGDVYVTKSADLLEKLVAEAGKDASPFRVYSGYAGWAPGQLEAETDAGSWHVFPAKVDEVFSPRPEELWHLLIEHTTLHLAALPVPAA